MSIASISFIQGISLGIEHIDRNDEHGLLRSILLDLFFLRFVVEFANT